MKRLNAESPHHWWVISPLILWGHDSIEYGPAEAGREVVSVAAPTKREAIRRGLPLMETWPGTARGDDQNPFGGVTAVLASCPHGRCFCDLCPEEECPECDQEAEL